MIDPSAQKSAPKYSPNDLSSLLAKPSYSPSLSGPNPIADASKSVEVSASGDSLEITKEGKDLSDNERMELAKQLIEIRKDISELRRKVRDEILEHVKDQLKPEEMKPAESENIDRSV